VPEGIDPGEAKLRGVNVGSGKEYAHASYRALTAKSDQGSKNISHMTNGAAA
jgi:hypothetical protein